MADLVVACRRVLASEVGSLFSVPTGKTHQR